MFLTKSEIGNLGEMIRLRKFKALVNGRLDDNATAAVWRETAEFHLQPGEIQNYHGRKSSEAQRLSGIQERLSDMGSVTGLESGNYPVIYVIGLGKTPMKKEWIPIASMVKNKTA